MLRHLKQRQQELERENSSPLEGTNACYALDGSAPRPLVMVAPAQVALSNSSTQRQQQHKQSDRAEQPPVKRVRGRRSSKPQMEKRRRARINECLDILKSYVLTDSTNLSRLGIELTGCENQDEETIARTLLKSSGLIHRHRGRKNPNKLEKADILELTVDYVRRLHEQRDQLLNTAQVSVLPQQQQIAHCNNLMANQQQFIQVPTHLNEPLTLDLSPKSRSPFANRTTPPPSIRAYAPPPNTPLTPPSSSGSSSFQHGDLSAQVAASDNRKQQHAFQPSNQMSQMILSRVLSNYQHCEWTSN